MSIEIALQFLQSSYRHCCVSVSICLAKLTHSAVLDWPKKAYISTDFPWRPSTATDQGLSGSHCGVSPINSSDQALLCTQDFLDACTLVISTQIFEFGLPWLDIGSGLGPWLLMVKFESTWWKFFKQARRQGGFEGVRVNHVYLLTSKKLYL